MDILKRQIAPIADVAWDMIDEEASRTLKAYLSARGVVDFCGPHGWSLASVSLGRLKTGKASSVQGVEWGTREVLPLTEIRVPFTLNQWDLDDVSRGAENPDLDTLVNAAKHAATFEENAVYNGFKNGGITGILEASPHSPLTLSKDPGEITGNIEEAVSALRTAGIAGGYALVLGAEAFKLISAGDAKGFPLRRRVQEMIGGEIHWSPAVDCGVLLSKRGGDYKITVGQDMSIGYESCGDREVKLFLAESFTFQILEPAAAVGLKWA